MITFYIIGNTFDLKEEIKKLKSNRKDFNSWLKYNYDFKCWELDVSNNLSWEIFRNFQLKKGKSRNMEKILEKNKNY